MTAAVKNVYIDTIDNIVDKDNNTNHRTIKMNTIYVEANTYIRIDVTKNEKDPKSKVRDHVRISKYKNIFTRGCTPDWSGEVLYIYYKMSKYFSKTV